MPVTQQPQSPPSDEPRDEQRIVELEDWTSGDRRLVSWFVPLSVVVSIAFYRWTVFSWLPERMALAAATATALTVHLGLLGLVQRARRVRHDGTSVAARVYELRQREHATRNEEAERSIAA